MVPSFDVSCVLSSNLKQELQIDGEDSKDNILSHINTHYNAKPRLKCAVAARSMLAKQWILTSASTLVHSGSRCLY